MSLQKKKKKQKTKEPRTRIIPPGEDKTGEDSDDEVEGGMYLEKEDMLVIYKALKNYKPVTDDEEMLYEILVEQFEEILIVDYKVKLPGVKR